MSEIEEALERIKNHKGVEGYVIVSSDGEVLRRYPGMTAETAEKYAEVVARLTRRANHVVRDTDARDALSHLRIRCQKRELLVSTGKSFMVIIVQRWTPAPSG